MHSLTLWKLAPSPDYSEYIDKRYPYSEVPYLGEYNLMKIPHSLNDLIDHVDYWGEGIGGFVECYNVNHALRLVSQGRYKDFKIPNRVPVSSYVDCDTSAYIRDQSVTLVTVSGSSMNPSCAADIARIINPDLGTVVVYRMKHGSEEFYNISEALKGAGLFFSPTYELNIRLKTELRLLSEDNVAFVNVTMLKDELHKLVSDGLYDEAVALSAGLGDQESTVICETVQKLLESNSSTVRAKVMSYAYKLWTSGTHGAVENNFPAPFKFILNQSDVTIVNKGYLQALMLDANLDSMNDRLAWGDSQDKTSKRMNWKFIPVWSNNEVTFKLYNLDCDMYLKLDANLDGVGDRKAWGSTNSGEVRHRYYVEPIFKHGDLAFSIINCQYRQGLKLIVRADSMGDRLLMGHNGDIYRDEDRFRWIISLWSQ